MTDHAREARQLVERYVTGGIVQDPADACECLTRRGVRPEHVEDETLRALVAALRSLHDAGTTVDHAMLVAQLTRDGTLALCGGLEGLELLGGHWPPGVSIDHHVGALLELGALQRAAGLHFAWADAESVMTLPDPVPLVEGILWRETLAAIVAPYESFKTFVALDLACAIASGRGWHGRLVAAGPVVYVLSEGKAALKFRLQAWREHYGEHDLLPIHFLTGEVKLTEAAQVGALLEDLRQLGVRPVAIFIDTLNRNFKGSESDDEAMNRFLDGCNALRRAFGATVVAVHHFGWSAERSRGSSSLPGHLDTEITLARDGERVTLKCTKQKDAAHFPDITLETVPAGVSLALRAVDNGSSPSVVVHATDRQIVHALSTHFPSGGATVPKLMDAAGIANRSTVYKALERLMGETYGAPLAVQPKRGEYALTDAGHRHAREALSTGPRIVHALSTPGSLPRPRVSPPYRAETRGQTGDDDRGRGGAAA